MAADAARGDAARLLIPSAAVSGLMRPGPNLALTVLPAGGTIARPAGVALPLRALLPQLEPIVERLAVSPTLLERLVGAEQGLARLADRDDGGGAVLRLETDFDGASRPVEHWFDLPGQSVADRTYIFEPSREGVLAQYRALRSRVAALRPTRTVGGWLYAREEGRVEWLWRLAGVSGGLEVIRLYIERPGEDAGFSVSFYRGEHLGEGRELVRRIMGFLPRPWRADTVDAGSGEYLGWQGTPALELRGDEIELLKRAGLVAPAPRTEEDVSAVPGPLPYGPAPADAAAGVSRRDSDRP